MILLSAQKVELCLGFDITKNYLVQRGSHQNQVFFLSTYSLQRKFYWSKVCLIR